MRVSTSWRNAKARLSTIPVNIRGMYAEFIKAICGKPLFCSSEECVMFPFALSLFDTGLLITVVIIMLLYLIVLIKLKAPAGGEKTLKTKSLNRNIQQSFSTERYNGPLTHHEHREERAENFGTIERPKSVQTGFFKTQKTENSAKTQPIGCSHHFGYLKEHPRNTPIPNECLTCAKITECL